MEQTWDFTAVSLFFFFIWLSRVKFSLLPLVFLLGMRTVCLPCKSFTVHVLKYQRQNAALPFLNSPRVLCFSPVVVPHRDVRFTCSSKICARDLCWAGVEFRCLTGTFEDGVTLTLRCSVWLTVISFRLFFFPPLLEFDPSNAVSKQMRKTKAACVPGSFWTSCL